MSFSLTLTFDTLPELTAAANAVQALRCVTPADAPADNDAAARGPRTSPGKPKAEKAAAPAASAEPAPSPAPAPAAVVKTPAVDYPTLQKSVFELAGLVQKKGLDSAEHVLSIAVGLGAPNFKGLDAGKWPEALAAVKAKIVEVAALEVEVA